MKKYRIPTRRNDRDISFSFRDSVHFLEMAGDIRVGIEAIHRVEFLYKLWTLDGGIFFRAAAENSDINLQILRQS